MCQLQWAPAEPVLLSHFTGPGGLLLKRTGEGWRKVLDGGPTGNGNTLYGAAVTDDGETWGKIGIADANVNFCGVDAGRCQ